MRLQAVALCVWLSLGAACSAPGPVKENPSMVTKEDVEKIARQDAAKAYRDLSIYDVQIEQQKDGWHVTFALKDKQSQGGGPEYVIDPSGKIVSKKYYQ